MKKLPVMAVSGAMVLSMLAGCGGSGDGGTQTGDSSKDGAQANSQEAVKDVGDMVTVNLALPSAYTFNDDDVQLVEDEINKILAEKYGIQVNMTYINSGSWVQQTNLMLTSDEVDVLPLWQTPLTTFVTNGQIIPLDDYMANASDAMKAVWTEDELNGTRVNGTLYAITNLRNFANDMCVHMSQAIVDELGIDVDSVKTFEDLDKVLYQVHEAHPELYALAPQSNNSLIGGWSWDGLGDEKYIGVIDDLGQNTQVQNLFNTDDFQEFVSYTYKWYQDGLIMPDILSNTESGEQMVNNGKAFAYLNNASNASPNTGLVRAYLLDTWAVGNSYAALSYGISTNSKHPDEAWTLMEAMYTDKDIATLLIDGIEGKHYVVNEDGTIAYPEGYDVNTVPYGGAEQYWVYPNAALTYPLEKNGATFFEDLVEFNRSAVISKSTGFNFDNSSVVDEYSACINIMDKYYKALMAGTLEPESTIAQANEELEAAGINDIIAAKQEQFDAFLNGQSK